MQKNYEIQVKKEKLYEKDQDDVDNDNTDKQHEENNANKN